MNDDDVLAFDRLIATLPVWMRRDFDCPDRGPHNWLPRVTSRGNEYEFCRNCSRVKKEYNPGELSAAEVISSW